MSHHIPARLAAQVTGLATTFNSTDLKATVFLPKNEAFNTLFSSLGLTMSQVFNSSSPFIPYLGQVRAHHFVSGQEHQYCQAEDGQLHIRPEAQCLCTIASLRSKTLC